MDTTPAVLNLSEIVTGMLACRSNARELIEEADMLAGAGRYARAFALLHTACEELGKFSVLELAGRRLSQANPPRWKRLWQRFRSHDSKTAQLQVQLLYLAASSDEALTGDTGRLADALFNYGTLFRNSALYVDTGPDGQFRKPGDIDFSLPLPALRALAQIAYEAASDRGDTVQQLEANLQARPNLHEKEVASRVLTHFLQRLADSGVTKEQALQILEKYFR